MDTQIKKATKFMIIYCLSFFSVETDLKDMCDTHLRHYVVASQTVDTVWLSCGFCLFMCFFSNEFDSYNDFPSLMKYKREN